MNQEIQESKARNTRVEKTRSRLLKLNDEHTKGQFVNELTNRVETEVICGIGQCVECNRFEQLSSRDFEMSKSRSI